MPAYVNNGSTVPSTVFSDISPGMLPHDKSGSLKSFTSPQIIKPHPGCLILGNDALKGNKYVTRYR